jgi:histidine phosphotransferase ChpT
MTDSLLVNPRVIDLVCSRVCHDLISPVSAINNGIELVTDMGEGTDGDAFGLIADSARIVAARLALMRYAFGAASPGLEEVREVASNYFADSKIQLNWVKGLTGEIAYKSAFPKMLLNVVMTLAEAIGVAGEVKVETAGAVATITGTPKGAAIRADIVAGMDDKIDPEKLDARTIQPYVTALLARRYGYTLAKTAGSDKIIVTLT